MTQIASQGDNAPITISALYKFIDKPDCADIRLPLKARMEELGIRGTLILAPEGINGTISGAREAIETILTYLEKDCGYGEIEHKESFHHQHPFYRTKVKLKQQILPFDVEVAPRVCAGTYVEPKNWNAIISREDVVTIDTRNDYEVHIGTFKGAINPATKVFREMVEWTAENLDPAKHPKVAMFCTGGIRCEKYSSYLLDIGFEEVYHLRGGILKYLEEIPQEQSMWEGSCFVFDERIAVGHGLVVDEDVAMCKACGHPLLPVDIKLSEMIMERTCRHCDGYVEGKGWQQLNR